jgi:hypothetical protein
MSTITNTLSEAELDLRKRRSAAIKSLRELIKAKSEEQKALRVQIKEHARANNKLLSATMGSRGHNKHEISAALNLYSDIRGKKRCHNMIWYGNFIYKKLAKSILDAEVIDVVKNCVAISDLIKQ